MSNRHSTKHRTMPKISKLRGRCPDGKIRFKDREMAIVALHRMKNAAARAVELNGTTTRTEKRTYFCGKCQGYHVTSKDSWQPACGKEIA
jgi:hypothetical protein